MRFVRAFGAFLRSPVIRQNIATQFRRCHDQAAPMFCIEDYDQFRNGVLHSASPVLVAFHADWSGPCQMFLPRLENAVMHYNALSVAKLNIDYCGDIAQEYGVENVPTIIGFVNGEEINRIEGVLEENDLYDLCERMLEIAQ